MRRLRAIRVAVVLVTAGVILLLRGSPALGGPTGAAPTGGSVRVCDEGDRVGPPPPHSQGPCSNCHPITTPPEPPPGEREPTDPKPPPPPPKPPKTYVVTRPDT